MVSLFKGFGGKKGYEEDKELEEYRRKASREDSYERDAYDRKADSDARERSIRRDTEDRLAKLDTQASEKDSSYHLGKSAKLQRLTTNEPWQQGAPLSSSTSSSDIKSIFSAADKKAERSSESYKEKKKDIEESGFRMLATEGSARQRDEDDYHRRTKEREIDYTRDADIRKHREKKEYDYKIERMKAKLKVEAERERRYGPSQFNVPGIGKALGGISQHRRYIQEQRGQELKQRGNVEFQRARLERLQQSRGLDPRSQSMGGFGAPLSMGNGMGQGMSIGPRQQQKYDEYGQPVSRDSMKMEMPGLGGGLSMGAALGGNPFAPQREPTQETPVRREFTPTRVIRKAPQSEVYAPGTGQEAEPGAIYIREMESYGPKYTRVGPEEVMEGETLFKKVKTSYGYKYIKLRGKR